MVQSTQHIPDSAGATKGTTNPAAPGAVRDVSSPRVATTCAASKPATWRSFIGEPAWPTALLFLVTVAGAVAVWAAGLSGLASLPVLTIPSVVVAYLAFTVMHEAVHGNIHGKNPRYRRLADAMGWVAGMFLLAPYGTFKVLHLQHHAHTNDPVRDPDHWVAGGSPLSVLLRCLSIVPWYYRCITVGYASQTRAGQAEHKAAFRDLSVLLSLGLFGTWLGYGSEVLLLWVVPALLATGLLAAVFDWLPHHPHSVQERYRDTRVILGPGLNLLLLGQNYHLIHHLFPRVPFYRYAACFRELRPQLEQERSPIFEMSGAAGSHQVSGVS